MDTKPKKQSNTVLHLRASLEELRSDLVGLEALANSAKEALEKLPYMSRPAQGSRYSDDEGGEYRLTYGRLTALVEGVAEAAKQVLAACDEAVEHSYEITEDDDGGDGGEGGSNGHEEPGALSGHNGGEPDTNGPEMRQAHGAVQAPQAPRSRAGIALDANPVPPELAPFIWTPAPLAVPGAPIPWAWQPWASA